MMKLLGVDTRGNFRDGPMQDVHWPEGLFGYFACYSLGAMYASQWFATMRRQIPDLDAQICAGNLDPVFDWLRDNIWTQAQPLDDRRAQPARFGRDAEPGALQGAPREALPGLNAQAISIARKSLTLVQRRPGDDRVAERLEEAVARRCRRGARAGCRPSAQARASVSGVEHARRRSPPAPSTPSVSPAIAWTPAQAVAARRAQRQQEFDVAAAAALAAHGDRRLAAGQQHARRARTAGRARRPGARCRPCTLPTSRASPSMAVAEDVRRDARLARDARRGLERDLRRGDHAHLGARQPRVAGLDRLAARRSRSSARTAAGTRDARSGDDGQRVGAGGRVGDGRAGGDVARVVAGHVGDQQRDDARRMAQRGRAGRP